MATKLPYTFHGGPINWTTEGIYIYVGGKWEKAPSLESVESAMKFDRPTAYIQLEDLC